ncbi:hypothetical protein O7628_10435 [Micromonospora sp. WMMD956]|uniref:hypothetical protein n=1 Tax=Micromonospora sp. WMMD956 TaxID=3016108 RepID=UPI002415CF5C|nr:hypothetical protein [Micromonospora sp. WMMD956]MDG4815922.1 hypothetical protein [Micromonospora sp. WMMD956]
MADAENAHKENRGVEPDDRPGHGRSVVVGLTVLGVLIAGAALARDYLDLTFRRADPGTVPSVSPAPTSLPSAVPTLDPGSPSPDVNAGTSGGQSGPAGIHLDALKVQSGGANLVELPRDLADRPGYERAIAITCPQNTSADKHREVTYPILRRYVEISATVRPYFPDDSQAKTYVSVIASVEQSDGTVNRLDRGGQAAQQGVPARLTADVENADELTLRVRCESPTGLVVLTDALLAPR